MAQPNQNQNPIAAVANTQFLGEKAWHWAVFVVVLTAGLTVWRMVLEELGKEE